MTGWKSIVVLIAAACLHNAQRMAPVPLMAELCTRLGVDYLGTGNLFSAHLFGTALFNIPVGILADRIDNKRLITAGSALGLVLSAVFAASHNYWVALGCRLGLGLSSALLFMPSIRYIVTAFPQNRRGTAMGFMEMGVAAGMIFSLVLLPVFAKRFDLTAAFMAVPILALPTTLLIAFVLPSAPPTQKPIVWNQIGTLAASRPFWYMGVYTFLNMLVVYIVIGWLPTYLRLDFGYSATQAGVLSAVLNVTLALFSPVAGVLSDRFNARTPVLAVGCLLSSVCLAAFLFSKNSVFIVGIILFLGAGMALTIPLVGVMVGEMFRDVGSGLAISVSNTIGRTAASLPGTIGGWLIQTTGQFSLLWSLAALLSLGRIPFLLAAKEKRAGRASVEKPPA